MTLFQVLFAHIKAQRSAPCDPSFWFEDTFHFFVLFSDHCACVAAACSYKNRGKLVVPYTPFLSELELVGTGFGGSCEP